MKRPSCRVATGCFVHWAFKSSRVKGSNVVAILSMPASLKNSLIAVLYFCSEINVSRLDPP
ncbi:MAG: hypothetical protein IJ681_04185 [Bacteroidales bacterium]|nr:hypothetical protein [Bacteroidales bacterium]